MSNKSDGNKFEILVCEILSKQGFWVHRLAPNNCGQPADIIAVKNQKAYLIDAKFYSTNRGFMMSRIEDNQEYAMTRWESKGNDVGWFCIGTLENQWMISHKDLFKLRENLNSLSPDLIKQYCTPFSVWINGHNN